MVPMPLDFKSNTRFFVLRTNFPFTSTSTEPRVFEMRTRTRSALVRTTVACGCAESKAPMSLARNCSGAPATVVAGAVVVGATESVDAGCDVVGAAEAGGVDVSGIAAAGVVVTGAVVVVGAAVVGVVAPDWLVEPM